MRTRLGMAVATAAALLAACTKGSGEPSTQTAPPPASSTTDVIEAPARQPIRLGENPLWTGNAALGVNSAELNGDSVLLTGTDAEHDNFLAVTDVATGTVRWTMEHGDELRGGGGAKYWWGDAFNGHHKVVGQGKDWMVLVEYELSSPIANHEPELGVAALSGSDGAVRWRAPIIPANDNYSRVMSLVDVRAGVAVVSVGKSRASDDPDEQRTVAVDTATGVQYWEFTGMRPLLIAGDTVVGYAPTATVRSTLKGVDLTTGRQRWSRDEHYVVEQNPGLETRTMTTSDTAMIMNLPQGKVSFLEARTGRPITELDTVRSCASDDESLIACQFLDDQYASKLATIRTGDSTVHIGKHHLEPHWYLYQVWQGHIFVQQGGAEWTVDLDRDGNQQPEHLRGIVRGISGDYAVLLTPGQTNNYGIYRVSG